MLRLRVSGLTRTRVLLKSLGDRAANLQPVFRGPVSESVRDFFRKQWESQGREGRQPWRSLAPFTEEWRADNNITAQPVLQGVSHRLWQSLTNRLSADKVERITPKEYALGTSLPYAAPLQDGWHIKIFGRDTGRRAPARKIIPDRMPREWIGRWDRMLADYIVENQT